MGEKLKRREANGLSGVNLTVEQSRVARKFEAAEAIGAAWYERYPEGRAQTAITRQEMAAVDQTEQRVLQQLQRLPKLSPEKVQAAIVALPDENPHIAGLPVPRKQESKGQ